MLTIFAACVFFWISGVLFSHSGYFAWFASVIAACCGVSLLLLGAAK